MKIQCDVCSKQEASVFCSADEAALCSGCDQGVHHANQLASKHQRFSLIHPSASGAPLCDICQEKKALLFCQQDRAILCRDCDLPIHTANEHTQRHNRFLLTGIKLFGISALHSSTPTTTIPTTSTSKITTSCSGYDLVPDFNSQPLPTKKTTSLPSPISTPCSDAKAPTSNDMNNLMGVNDGGGLTSSISEYLIEMLPGWQVEDLLDSTSATSGFCKGIDDDLASIFNRDPENRFSSSEKLGRWVPQAPVFPQTSAHNSTISGLNGAGGAKTDSGEKVNRKWIDDGFTVPEISPQSKRSKPLRPTTQWQKFLL
ncbi:hypothetical protein Ancab_028976 [Ancistrocladus abbreviatus]